MSTEAQREAAAAPGQVGAVSASPLGSDTQMDAADQMARLIAGNKALVTHPQLVGALMGTGATVAQSQAINQYVAGMQAQQAVVLARQSGVKISLDSDQTAALDQMGVGYSDVQFTTADLKAQIEAQLNPQKAASSGGWSFGRVLHDVTHNPVTNVIGKGFNWTSAVVSGSPTETWTLSDQEKQAMTASGYDPTSWFSLQAYLASGVAIDDSSSDADLYKNQDPAKVDSAIKFANDPKGFIQGIISNPNLTPEQMAGQLNALSAPDFKNLVTKIGGRRATVGNELAGDVGIDPVKNPDLYKATSASIDIVSSFLIDPTLIAGSALKAWRSSAVLIDSLGDTNKVNNILNGSVKGVYATRVRTGMQSFLDNANTIRTGDDLDKATAYARIRSLTPGLEHLLPDFLGTSRALDVEDTGATVVKGFTATGRIIMGEGDPITNMAEAAKYLSSKVGIVRLFSGNAASEVGLMPGMLSRFGAKQVRASLAAGLTSRGLKTSINLSKSGVAARVIPAVNDAADVATGRVIAVNAAGEAQISTAGALASQARAAAATKDVADAGDALLKSRTGFGPAAMIARTKLLAQRWGSYLPRTTEFSISDPDGAKRVFQYANMYLTRSDANLLAARYAAGSEGTRKALLTGLQLQTMHAAGLGTSEAGRAMIDDAGRSLVDERYSTTAGKIDDPSTGLRRDAAVFPSQVEEKLTLAPFQDLQKAAAKTGIWESTIGRAFNNPVTDSLLGLVRTGWLTTFSNVVRNAGEDLFGAFTRGEFAGAMRSKAVASRAGMLPHRAVTDTLIKGVTRTKAGNLLYSPIYRLGSLYRSGIIKLTTEEGAERLNYIASLDRDELARFADAYVSSHLKSMVDPGGVNDTNDIVRSGFNAKRMKFTGYDEQATEGQVGAERLAAQLGMVYNGNKDLAQTIIDHLTEPGKTGMDDIVGKLKADPRTVKMIRTSLLETPDGRTVRAVTNADKELALHQLAVKQATEVRYLLSNQDTTLNSKLIEYLNENGRAPDAEWIQKNLTSGIDRPITVNAPMYEAVTTQPGVASMVGALADVSGKAYKALIEKPIARISSMPIFLDNYGRARVFAKGWETALLEGGMSPEAANRAATDFAMQTAFRRTLKYIDDPTLRTQMDVVGRNFFAFSRATQAFVRRWGTSFIEDPGRLRKSMLAMEASQKSGLVYTDQNGQKQFVFPGSGAAINEFMKVADIIPGVDLMKVAGVAPNMTGKFAFLSPGLQNPFQMSLTPMVNIPMRAVFSLFPQHKVALDQVDEFFNGTQGQGASALSELEPTAVKKFTDALNSDDRDSLMADATRSALLNLAAAGKLPPPGADAAQRQVFLSNVQSTVKNQLIARAIFGFFSPTPPGVPSEDTSGSGEDWYYGPLGVRNLDDEYKLILNQTNGDVGEAGQIWASLHPDKQFYTTSTTNNMTKSAEINATKQSQAWINQNIGFMKSYSGVAAYFIPPGVQTGQFDLGAYNAELELGLRQHKSTAEFFNDVAVANSTAMYYQSLAARDAAVQADPASKATVLSQFSDWQTGFNSLNPMFASTQTDYSQAAITAQDQLAQLRRMVGNPSGVPSDVPVAAVKEMVAAYDSYHSAVQAYPGETTAALAAHADFGGQYNDWWESELQRYPQLAALYQGVFRTLDNKVLDPIGSST